MAALTKTELWTKAQEILDNAKVSKANQALLAELFAPKKGGASSRPEDIDGQTYCRYTGEYWDYDAMVYQNADKREKKEHKGYSKEGIARWTKGGNYLAKIKDEAFELAMSGKTDEAKALKLEIDKFDRNSFEDLKRFKS